MREAILNALEREVYRRCQQPANRFGMGCYDHIAAVVKHGVELARRYGGDEEIVAVAAWLHDIASVITAFMSCTMSMGRRWPGIS